MGESTHVVASEEPTSKIIAPLTPKLRAPAMPAERAAKFDDSERLARIASNPEPLSAKPLLDPPGSSTIAPRKAIPRKAPARNIAAPIHAPTPHEAAPLTPLAQAKADEQVELRVEQTFAANPLPLQEQTETFSVSPVDATSSKLKKIAPPSIPAAPMTLAERLEMARLARESAPSQIGQPEPIDDGALKSTVASEQLTQPSVLAKSAPISVRKVPASVLIERAMGSQSSTTALPTQPIANEVPQSTELHAPQLPLETHKNTTRRAVSSKPATLTAVKPTTAPVIAARNVMLGFALAYVEQFERHIGGPLMTLWTHKGSFISGFFHVMMPLLMAYLCSHWTPETQAFFLEGGYMSNLGKLSWLYVVSGFLWTLLFMLASRLFFSFKQDGARFERIGRGFLSPHNDK